MKIQKDSGLKDEDEAVKTSYYMYTGIQGIKIHYISLFQIHQWGMVNKSIRVQKSVL